MQSFVPRTATWVKLMPGAWQRAPGAVPWSMAICYSLLVDLAMKNGEFPMNNCEFPIEMLSFPPKMVIDPQKVVISPLKVVIYPLKMVS